MMRAVAFILALTLVAACGAGSPDQTQTRGGQTSVAAAPAGGDPRAAIFVEKGCPQCHAISALGVKSAAEVGPDLTLAYEDVQTRFGVELDEFLANPTGTMQIVLGSQITLTAAERDSIYDILRRLYEEREQRATGAR